ncbi:MAG: preprotein translocase subunit SecG [Planctomycetota bacterium]
MQYALLIILAVLFVGISALMMLIILIQRPKGGGLSGAFGGAGGSADAAFGAKAGDVLTWATVGFFVAFLLVAIGLQWVIHPHTAPFNFATPASSTTVAPPLDADATSTGADFDPAALPLEIPTDLPTDAATLDVEFAPIVVEEAEDAASDDADAAAETIDVAAPTTDDPPAESPATP